MSTEIKYDVFISYSRKDYVDEATKQVIPGNVVSQIKEMFDANGISYWFDEDGIYSGDAFAPLIAKNIKSAKIFLFISSKNSNASEWTSNEIATAHAYKKKIIPFRYDDSVYNDSVIIYIARLDYIEYQSNPSKALSRLLSSIQTYLKSEKDREEKEKEAEERRLNEEKSKQEKANKLQQIREQIENLETRKYQIEQEISEQEKALSGLRNEKRIVEDKIENLRIERSHLLGYQHVDEKKKPKPEPKDDKQNTFFVREWKKLKEAMSLKHWIVNAFLVILLVGVLFWLNILTISIFNYFHHNKCFLLLLLLCELLGIISILRNKRNGLWWFVVSVIPTLLTDEEELLLICMTAWIITSLMMFVRKNGRSAWSVVWNSTPPKSVKKTKMNAFINRIKANRNVKWAVIISIVVAASIMPILFRNDESEYQEVLFDTTCVAIDTCAVVDTCVVGYYDEYAETYTINIGGYNRKGGLKPQMQYTLNLMDGGVENNCEFYLEDAPRGTRIEGNKLITGSVGGTIVICGKGYGFNVEPRTLEVEVVKQKSKNVEPRTSEVEVV